MRMIEVWGKVSPDLFERGFKAKPALLRSLAGMIGTQNGQHRLKRLLDPTEWGLIAPDLLNCVGDLPTLGEDGAEAARNFARSRQTYTPRRD